MGNTTAAVVCLLTVAGSVVGLGSSVGAVSVRTGVITGTVMECGPGPIVASPGEPSPSPKPVSVVLIHDKHAFESEPIKFPQTLPWIGSFFFNVPAGRYEVVSTYQGHVRWVKVRPGSRNVVSFGLFACPD